MTCRRGFCYVSACWLMFTLVACLAPPESPASKTALPVEVLAVGGQCFPAPKTWTAAWISSPEQLQETVSRCRSNRIGAVQKEVPSVDFDRFGVLVVEMGEKRSAGYGFDADKVTVSVEKKTATINLIHNQPSPDAVTAQVMTAPWILIRMPLGSYRDIRIMDQNGRMLARIPTP